MILDAVLRRHSRLSKASIGPPHGCDSSCVTWRTCLLTGLQRCIAKTGQQQKASPDEPLATAEDQHVSHVR